MLTYAAAPQISLNPSPTFLLGDTLTVRVGDASANTPGVVDTVAVQAESTAGLNMTIQLVEEGADRGVFSANLPADYSKLGVTSVGDRVTVTYGSLPLVQSTAVAGP
ncbi:MAG: hypothetical protein PVG22_11570 [Chromatiales bacterium]|jgi:hypothetical protein